MGHTNRQRTISFCLDTTSSFFPFGFQQALPLFALWQCAYEVFMHFPQQFLYSSDLRMSHAFTHPPFVLLFSLNPPHPIRLLTHPSIDQLNLAGRH
mmetsp:Transcript_55836/g.109300  ORF Transcript_55836/g.109300 Transcript_55836/m.109300 type:complete len:96 (+) Transcript_55836:382-669(+)